MPYLLSQFIAPRCVICIQHDRSCLAAKHTLIGYLQIYEYLLFYAINLYHVYVTFLEPKFCVDTHTDFIRSNAWSRCVERTDYCVMSLSHSVRS